MPQGTEGLSTTQAGQLLDRYGKNALPDRPANPIWKIFFKEFKSFLVFLLLIAFLVSVAVGDFVDGGFILLIAVLNAIFGTAQEYQANKAIDQLRKFIQQTARVIRDGKEIRLDTVYIVPGDIVILSEGDQVPADGKILAENKINVNEAILTGESGPVEKNFTDDLYLGTTVLSGRTKMQVTATGAETKFGKISQSLSKISEEKTPLEIKLESLGRKIGLGVLLIVTVLSIVGLTQQREFSEIFFTSVALSVAAIPEGLPAVLTIALAVGVRRLAKQKTIVKRLAATESLGSVDVICTDKTGTLTTNQMTVRHVFTRGDKTFDVSGEGYRLDGEIIFKGEKVDSSKEPILQKIVKISALCNSSSLGMVEDGGKEFNVLGDTTEGALLILAKKFGEDYEKIRQQNPIIEEISFDSRRKLMTVATMSEVLVKGAPEQLLNICSNISPEERDVISREVRAFAQKGYRIIAFGQKRLVKRLPKEDLENNLEFLGFATISDPPRKEVEKAIDYCRKAGISVVMITGDHPDTARAIGEEIGLISKGETIVTGEQVKMYSDTVLDQNLESIKIFARVSPEDKLRIVTAYQRKGNTVSVTGDGVNDSLALKKAQVGVAMGKTGTDVAKEAADIVITDDNFATIISAIEEGKVIFQNLVKAITYLLSCNLAEVLVVTLAVTFNFPLPFSPLAILWMNLVTDGLPALALAIDPKSRGDWKKAKEILDPTQLRIIVFSGISLGIAGFISYVVFSPLGLEAARIYTFSVVVILELIMAFTVRGRGQKLTSNSLLILAVGIALFLQTIIIFVPQVQGLFN